MDYRVTGESVTRTATIRLDLGQVEDMDVSESWHRRSQVVRPDYVRISWSSDTIETTEPIGKSGTRVTVSGPRVLASGKISAEGTRGSTEYSDTGFRLNRRIDKAPEWVRDLVEEFSARWAEEFRIIGGAR